MLYYVILGWANRAKKKF